MVRVFCCGKDLGLGPRAKSQAEGWWWYEFWPRPLLRVPPPCCLAQITLAVHVPGRPASELSTAGEGATCLGQIAGFPVGHAN